MAGFGVWAFGAGGFGHFAEVEDEDAFFDVGFAKADGVVDADLVMFAKRF